MHGVHASLILSYTRGMSALSSPTCTVFSLILSSTRGIRSALSSPTCTVLTPAYSCPTHVASCQPCQVLHERCSRQPILVLHTLHHVSLVKSYMHGVHTSLFLSYTRGIMSALSSPTCMVFTPAFSCPTHMACQPCQVLHA